MATTRRLFDACASVAIVALSSCGSPEPAPVRPLCGTAEHPARVAMENRAPSARLGRGWSVLFDNGAPYVFVDKECNYWVNNPWQVFDETRTGILDESTALRLGETFSFNAWDDLHGVWSDDGAVFDAPLLVFDDSTHAVGCAKLCGSPDVPMAVQQMRDALPDVGEELWRGGVPAASAVRVITVLSEPSSSVSSVEWPLARPITDFLRTETFIDYGQGILEDDMESARLLKELRASFLRGDHGFFVGRMLVVSDDVHYELYVRDALPFEDANGIVPLSVDVSSF